MPALPLSFAHPSVNLPDAGGLAPLSEDEIAALTYAAWRQHLDEIAALVETDKAADRAKEAAARAAQDAREGKALTLVLNRLGFAVSALPSNVYRAPDGILFALSAYREGESAYNAISAQPVEKQEPDHFYLRVMYALDVSTDDDADTITASRVFGDHRRMTADQILNIQAQLPAAIEAVKAEVKEQVEARARRIAALAADKPKLSPVPQFYTEYVTLDQMWEQGMVEEKAVADLELDDKAAEGWSIVNIAVAFDFFDDGEGEDEDGEKVEYRVTYVHRVVTLTRQVPVEAVSE